MALETVLIDGHQYRIHQVYDQYAIDAIGNPCFIGEDYLKEQIEVLTRDRELTDDGDIKYTFAVREMDEGFEFILDITQTEDVFIAYCTVELEKDKIPSGVRHINGDKWDNCDDNLEWTYNPQD